MAELATAGFDTFIETENGFEACLLLTDFDKAATLEILSKYELSENQYQFEEIEQQNWNAQWESNFEPVVINEQLRITAPFHTEAPSFLH